MDFLELQNEVLFDRFGEAQRDRIKRLVNYRYGRIWAAGDWGFKYQTTEVTGLGGDTFVSKAGMGDIISVADTTLEPGYYPLVPYYQDEFYEHSVTTEAVPSAYTVIGNNLHFNSALPGDRTYRIISKVPFTTLIEDEDVPLIPEEFHYLLVDGAAAEALRLENDPSWQGFEDSYQTGLDDMKKEYLSEQVRAFSHYPSWP